MTGVGVKSVVCVVFMYLFDAGGLETCCLYWFHVFVRPGRRRKVLFALFSCISVTREA